MQVQSGDVRSFLDGTIAQVTLGSQPSATVTPLENDSTVKSRNDSPSILKDFRFDLAPDSFVLNIARPTVHSSSSSSTGSHPHGQ